MVLPLLADTTSLLHCILATKTVSRTVKGLQANKLVWHSFVGAGRRLRSRVRHKRLSFTHRNSPSITFLFGSQAPVPTGQHKEERVIPTHVAGLRERNLLGGDPDSYNIRGISMPVQSPQDCKAIQPIYPRGNQP